MWETLGIELLDLIWVLALGLIWIAVLIRAVLRPHREPASRRAHDGRSRTLA